MKLKANKLKIAVAMSGGVDSSVVAKMMVDEGHQVVGLFLKLWSDPTCTASKQNRCCDYEALADAREVANKLGINFYVIDAKDEFKKLIVDDFIMQYKKLRTPNPCIKCNEYIKFDLLLKKALDIGCDKLVTGHYARIIEDNSGNLKYEYLISKQIQNTNDPTSLKLRGAGKNTKNLSAIPSTHTVISSSHSVIPAKAGIQKRDPSTSPRMTQCHLKAGIDPSKDQSYMLYRLDQVKLSRLIFPLGDKLKKDVRKMAVKWNLPVKEKPESQEICFFGDKDYRSFLRRYLDESYFKSGKIVNSKGDVLGKHEGLINYTVGQRKGIVQDTRNKRQDTKILYVIGFDVEKNQLIVGEDREVYKKEMIVSSVNWINGLMNKRTKELKNITVKIRYRHDAVGCRIEPMNRETDKHKNLSTKELKNNESKSIDSVIPDHDQKSSQSVILPARRIGGSDNEESLKVIFEKPQRAITPGQSAVFYLPSEASAKDGDGDEVLGGGIIEK